MNKTLLSLLLISIFPLSYSQIVEETRTINYHPSEFTIKQRISPPEGYYWQDEVEGSFADYLTQQVLAPEGFPVRDFRKNLIKRQDLHVAVFETEVGAKDLQQCADAWIRLYADYLWEKKRFDDIVFQLTSEQPFSWNDFKNGVRTVEDGERVQFLKTGKFDYSYDNFRNYLDVIFQYSGTKSLDKESVSVKSNADIRVGDYLLKPGSPGHLTMIVGVAKNKNGKKIYLLAESFMPAQDIHIIKNPKNKLLSPWYELDTKALQIVTAKYRFGPNSIKRLYQLIQ